MNDVKLLHIKCGFFPIFQWSGGIKKSKKFLSPPRKSWNDAPVKNFNNFYETFFNTFKKILKTVFKTVWNFYKTFS